MDVYVQNLFTVHTSTRRNQDLQACYQNGTIPHRRPLEGDLRLLSLLLMSSLPLPRRSGDLDTLLLAIPVQSSTPFLSLQVRRGHR